MQLSPQLWESIRTCNEVWMKFRGTNEYKRAARDYSLKRHGTDLCHAARVVFLWAPVSLAINFITYMIALAVLTYYPATLFGLWSLIPLFAVVGLIAYAIVRVREDADQVEEAITAQLAKVPRAARYLWTSTGIDTLTLLLVQFIIATKRAICPKIEPPMKTEDSR